MMDCESWIVKCLCPYMPILVPGEIKQTHVSNQPVAEGGSFFSLANDTAM